MTIAIFPGTFNPIHVAHLIIAETARTRLKFDKVIFITSNIPPHRDNCVAEPNFRFEMVQIACTKNQYFEASNIEIIRQGTSYTHETISEIETIYNIKEKINFLIGSDAFCQLHTWKNAQKIVDRCNFILIDRPLNEKVEEYVKSTTLKSIQFEKLFAPQMEISSTMIRNRIALGESIKYLVLDEILDYINKHKLYSCTK